MRPSAIRPPAHALLLALPLATAVFAQGVLAQGVLAQGMSPQGVTPPEPTATPATPPADAPAAPLAPFQAEYTVHRGGKHFGEARLALASAGGADWRVSLDLDATRGLFGLAGLDAHQRTDFRVAGGEFRPLVQQTRREALFFDRTSTGRYDWQGRSARWSGDVSDKRKAPVPLHAGDLSSLLVNLAVVRDAAPGATLDYRVVDNGRARPHRYRVSAVKESISVEGIAYNALRVERSDKRDEQTIFWIAEGVPTPIRILQREDGEDVYDLRLVDYRGA